MKKIIKAILATDIYKALSCLFVVFLLSMGASSLQAQDFPNTEKEVSDILCTGKWTLDSMGKSGKMMAAGDAGMDGVTLVFKDDSTYIGTLFGKDKPGKWVIDLAGKQVKLYEKKTEPESVIRIITRGQLIVTRGDESDLKMLFRQDK